MIYKVKHVDELEKMGFKYNPYLLPLTFSWCVHCKGYRHFHGYSKDRDNISRNVKQECQVCTECGYSSDSIFQVRNQLCLPF